ncbi:MAG: beta-galactosidase [Alistipes sp.]|nr:beta-galactosidase [Alistipes sp.]
MKKYILLSLLLALGAPARAREIYPLNEGWRFFFASEPSSDNACFVTLPHSWNNNPTAKGSLLETTGLYHNDLYLPAEWASKRIFVRFYGAQNVTDLFVNGRLAGEHRGGSTAFAFEITDKVRFGSDNSLLAVVSNAARSNVLPTSSETNCYGGLYREAELIVTERTAVSPLYLGTDGVLVRQQTATAEKAEGEIEIHLTSSGDNTCTVAVDITGPDGRKVFADRIQHAKIEDKPLKVAYSVPSPKLWSPARPALYTVNVTVSKGSKSDKVSVRTGFRQIEAVPETLLLNGDSIKIRGVVLYHDNALSAGTLTDADYDLDLQEIRTLGANALRSAMMPHAQHLYDRCDEQGMLVWIDTPLHRAPFLSDAAYYATPGFERNGLQQLQEIVAQNINHPSVVMWGLFSRLRTTGDDVRPYVRMLREELRALDASRPTVAVSDQNGDINFITDMIVWRQAVGWGKGKADDLLIWLERLGKNWSHLRSGIAYGAPGLIGHADTPLSGKLATNRMPEERQALFHEEYARCLQNDSLLWGVWIENMFDYGSVRNPYGVNGMGLMTIDRRRHKDAYYLYKALWNKKEPTLHLVGKRHNMRRTPRQTFHVYSSAGEPLMMIGSDTVAMNEYAPCQYRSDTVELTGRAEIRVRAGKLHDRMTVLIDYASKPPKNPDPQQTEGPQTTN